MATRTTNRLLRFDRMLTKGLWQQFAWILCILVITWAVSYICLSCSGSQWKTFCYEHDIRPWLLPVYLLVDTNALNNLYLDSDGTAVHGWMLIVSSVTYIIGLFVFNGVIISVLSNWIAQRKENFTHGISRYHSSGHYVIMGYDEMVPSVIASIFRKDKDAQILVLSAQSSVIIRERIHKSVPKEHFDQIVVNYGHRIARDYYPDIQLEAAKEIYVVGKRSLPNHDAVNVACVESIFDYLEDCKDKTKPNSITCVFEDFDTYSAFKLADIFDKAKQLHIEFIPYNYYLGWAKQVFVARRYFSTKGDKQYQYPSVYREGIGYHDPHFVHLVFVGTSTFAVAFAMEAAHMLHFPNATSLDKDKGSRKPIKTKITFIDLNADTEMLLFRTRNRHFFEIQSCTYTDMTVDNSKTITIAPTLFGQNGMEGDFLDIDFEFIKGNVFSSKIQEEMKIWARDEQQYLSVFLAMANQRDNFAIAMNMPDDIYNHSVPIFIRQDNADTFVTELRNAHTVTQNEEGVVDKREKFHVLSKDGKEVIEQKRAQRYANLYPFGMNETSFFFSNTDVLRAQLCNYLYETADYNTYSFKDKTILASISTEMLLQEAQQYWQKLKVSLKWSNLYAVESIPCKMASIDALKKEKDTLSEEQQIDCMAQVEHNRWNVEKLLMGYRKPLPEEDKYSVNKDNKDAKNMQEKLGNNKKYHYAHSDIRPFNKLDIVSNLDEEYIKYLPWIVSLVP